MARAAFIAQDHPRYKWVALSNTTLGMLIATINASIVIISLPAIFRGIQLEPARAGQRRATCSGCSWASCSSPRCWS